MEHYENQSNSNLDLAQFDDAFETAEVEEREFEAVPDGKLMRGVITSRKNGLRILQ